MGNKIKLKLVLLGLFLLIGTAAMAQERNYSLERCQKDRNAWQAEIAKNVFPPFIEQL